MIYEYFRVTGTHEAMRVTMHESWDASVTPVALRLFQSTGSPHVAVGLLA